MNKNLFLTLAGIALLLTGLIAVPSMSSQVYSQGAQKKVLRLGYFPNITHGQAVIGVANGDYQKVLGPDIELKTYTFNAGPSAIEALFANQIDATYVGSGPAVNGYIVSGGKNLRIISGAASGGAVFVVRNDSGIQSPKDFAGKRFASPQLGNTQDIALRKYLLNNGYQTKEHGGNVSVIPVANPDILTLLLKKDIDGAWVPEPWGEKLIKEGNSRLFLDERSLWPNGKFITVNIAVNPEYLRNNPDVVKKLLEAHINETQWINSHKEDALKIFNTELKRLTGQTIPEDELKAAFSRLDLTYEPLEQAVLKAANNAFDIGFLGKTRPDLSGLFDLTLLNEVLKEKGLQTISESTGSTNEDTSSGNTQRTLANTNVTANATALTLANNTTAAINATPATAANATNSSKL